MAGRSLISIVIPAYNEADNVENLYAEIVREMDPFQGDIEVIFIDDGSSDATATLISRICEADRRVKLIWLSRNFGGQLAVLAGLEAARGDATIVMDADLQHPPTMLMRMVSLWQEGYEVVFATRKRSTDTGMVRRVASFAFGRVFRVMSGLEQDPDVSDFHLMDRRVVAHLVQMRERNRFFRGLVAWLGFRQVGIPYEAPPRGGGKTKFGFRKLTGLAVDAITSFSTIPLRLCTFVGVVSAVAVLPYAFWAIYVRLFTDRYVPGWAALVVAILFLGGVQLMSLGILGEYIGRIYEEVKRRPLYVVRDRVGFEDESEPGGGLSADPVQCGTKQA